MAGCARFTVSAEESLLGQLSSAAGEGCSEDLQPPVGNTECGFLSVGVSDGMEQRGARAFGLASKKRKRIRSLHIHIGDQ